MTITPRSSQHVLGAAVGTLWNEHIDTADTLSSLLGESSGSSGNVSTASYSARETCGDG